MSDSRTQIRFPNPNQTPNQINSQKQLQTKQPSYQLTTSTFKNLSPKTRLGVGIGIITWGLLGLYLSDHAERKLGYTPSEKDKEDLWKWAPTVTTVDRTDRN
ncbi:hypothetical protein E4U21_004418 [Claviceps maximensis]|nr:hypothetical protein E4U21_004418 [Claviceps maximensis]